MQNSDLKWIKHMFIKKSIKKKKKCPCFLATLEFSDIPVYSVTL